MAILWFIPHFQTQPFVDIYCLSCKWTWHLVWKTCYILPYSDTCRENGTFTHTDKRLQFAIENGPVDIVDLPIYSMVVFHSFLLTFTRGYIHLKQGTKQPDYGTSTYSHTKFTNIHRSHLEWPKASSYYRSSYFPSLALWWCQAI